MFVCITITHTKENYLLLYLQLIPSHEHIIFVYTLSNILFDILPVIHGKMNVVCVHKLLTNCSYKIIYNKCFTVQYLGWTWAKPNLYIGLHLRNLMYVMNKLLPPRTLLRRSQYVHVLQIRKLWKEDPSKMVSQRYIAEFLVSAEMSYCWITCVHKSPRSYSRQFYMLIYAIKGTV